MTPKKSCSKYASRISGYRRAHGWRGGGGADSPRWLHAPLSNNRSRRNQLEKALTFCEAEMDNHRKLRKLERDYLEMRERS
ncbi:hypothetical protein ACLK17_05815 [Escherichia coli]